MNAIPRRAFENRYHSRYRGLPDSESPNICEKTTMANKNITPIATIVGAALVGSLSAVELANAAENPFGASSLESGYMVVAEADAEGKCGEGKCGEGMMNDDGSKSGGEKEEGEGKCGGEKMEGEGKCGSST